MMPYALSFPTESAGFPEGAVIRTPAGEVGANVAEMYRRGIGAMGSQLERLGQEVFSYQQEAQNIQNTIANNNAVTNFAKQGLDITQNFTALKGQDALDAQKDANKRLDDLSETMLSNPDLTPRQRAMLSSSLTSLGDRYRLRMAEHAAQQQDVAWKKSITEAGDQAAISAEQTSVWGGPEHVEFDLQAGISAIQQPGLGAGPADVRDYIGKTVKRVIDYQIYLNNPIKAQQFLDYYRNRMDPASIDASQRTIDAQINELHGNQNGQEIFRQGLTHTQGLTSTAASVNLAASSALSGEGIDLSKVITERSGPSITYSLKGFSEDEQRKIFDHFSSDRRIPKGGMYYDDDTQTLRITVGGGGPRAALPSAIGAVVDREAARVGLDPNTVRQIVAIESGGRPGERTPSGTYNGLLQLSHKEFVRGGGTGNILDPEENIRAGVNVLAEKAREFERDFRRPPTATDLYMLHQQGEAGARAHLRNPDELAWKNMYSTAEGQRMGLGWARQTIWGQAGIPRAFPGGVDTITSRAFLDYWRQKIEGSPVVAAR